MNIKQFLTSAKENKKWNQYTSEELFKDAMEYYQATGENLLPIDDYEVMNKVSKKYSSNYDFKELPLEVALLSGHSHTEYQKLVILQKLIETPNEEVPENTEYWRSYFLYDIILEDEDKKDYTVLDILLQKECTDLLTSDLFDYDKVASMLTIPIEKDEEFFNYPIEHAAEINAIKSRKTSEQYNENKDKVKVKVLKNKPE